MNKSNFFVQIHYLLRTVELHFYVGVGITAIWINLKVCLARSYYRKPNSREAHPVVDFFGRMQDYSMVEKRVFFFNLT